VYIATLAWLVTFASMLFKLGKFYLTSARLSLARER
jgi:hypothetical protein